MMISKSTVLFQHQEHTTIPNQICSSDFVHTSLPSASKPQTVQNTADSKAENNCVNKNSQITQMKTINGLIQPRRYGQQLIYQQTTSNPPSETAVSSSTEHCHFPQLFTESFRCAQWCLTHYSDQRNRSYSNTTNGCSTRPTEKVKVPIMKRSIYAKGLSVDLYKCTCQILTSLGAVKYSCHYLMGFAIDLKGVRIRLTTADDIS